MIDVPPEHRIVLIRAAEIIAQVMDHLIRDVGSDLKHVDPDDYDGHRHEVSIVEGTPLHEWPGTTRFMANSVHHPGIKTLGE